MKILVALGNVEWEAQLLGIMGHPMLGIQIQRRCVDAIDARAAMQVHQAQVLLVSDATLRVDRDLVNDAASAGVTIVALSGARERWLEVGIDHVVAVDAGNLSAVVQDIVAIVREADSVPVAVLEPSGQGILVAGVGGGAGRSTCVRELAYALTTTDDALSVLMADADTYGPSLALELGADRATNGLLTACRASENRQLDVGSLGMHIVDVQRNIALLPGLPRSSRWTDVRVPSLLGVWQVARQAFDAVVIDGGPVLEVDPSMSIEHTLPKRHAAILTALEASATVVLCARADSVGVARLIRGYLESDGLLDSKRIVVVLAGTHGRGHRKDLEQAITRHTGLPSVFSVPSNPEAMHRALVHNTFASLIDKDIASVFVDAAGAVLPARTLSPAARIAPVVRDDSIEASSRRGERTDKTKSARSAKSSEVSPVRAKRNSEISTEAIDDYLGGSNVA